MARSNQNRRPELEKSDIVRQIPLACTDELAAVEFLEAQRWGKTPCCVHCGSVSVYKMVDAKDAAKRNARFLWRCRDCKKQYTVRVGTVYEESRLPLRHWCYAFWAACASKKGVSALQIMRQCQISYKSALFVMHRIRFAMTETSPTKLRGTVEVDETYVGGKNKKGFRGRCQDNKTPVVALISRTSGQVRVPVVANVTALTLKGAIRDNVAKSAAIHTDGFASYKGIGDEFKGGHESVDHVHGEYARDGVHVNSCESFFALLKRGLHRTFHAVSKEHLHRYVAEFAFRYNARHLNDGDRTVLAIQSAEGKRLMYRGSVA